MTTVAIVTSIYGSYDTPKRIPEQSHPHRSVAVLGEQMDMHGWEVVVEPRPHMHPRLAAKVAKCNPELYVDADVTIWIDGSATVTSPHFVEMCLDAYVDSPEGIAQWNHPERQCIEAEAGVSMLMHKYQGQPCLEQVRQYRQKGHPLGGGLWATGCIVRGRGFERFGTEWLAEQVRWSYQDQLSEPWVLAQRGLKVHHLPESLWHNQWIHFGGHRSEA